MPQARNVAINLERLLISAPGARATARRIRFPVSCSSRNVDLPVAVLLGLAGFCRIAFRILRPRSAAIVGNVFADAAKDA
jgi:hypothetical protein